MEKLLILDSNSLMNRAFYAIPPLTNSEGIHTNAIYGFTNMLLKMKEDINPDYIVATFDKKAPTFRHKEYDEYKAGRKKMPEELSEQFPIIKELLGLLAINIYEIDGFEADDIIGTVAKIAEKNNIEVYIVTGDKDALQLATKTTKVVITKKGVSETAVYDEKIFIDEFGITPIQFIDVKGLMGDKSDNIPGIPGVGEKTAFKLIQTYGSIEEALNNINEISGNKLKENLTTYSEQGIFSKKLATIMTEVPIEIDLDEIKSKDNYDGGKLKKLLLRLGMKSVINKLGDIEDEEEDIIIIDRVSTLKGMKETLENEKDESYITYTTLNAALYSQIEIDELILGKDGRGIAICINQILKENKEECLSVLRSFMQDDKIKKIIQDSKSLITILNKHQIQLNSLVFDTPVAAYIIDSSRGKYDKLAVKSVSEVWPAPYKNLWFGK